MRRFRVALIALAALLAFAGAQLSRQSAKARAYGGFLPSGTLVSFDRMVPVGASPEDVSWVGSPRKLVVLAETGETVDLASLAVTTPSQNAVLHSPFEPPQRLVIFPMWVRSGARAKERTLPEGTILSHFIRDFASACLDVGGKVVPCESEQAVWSYREATAEVE